MAALMTATQISNGSPAYESYYRQVDPGNTGRVGAVEAAQFLKTSGLSDSTLGKIWDLADMEQKGYLDKRGFFIALRLVASAQSGNDISHNSLTQAMPPPPSFRDTSSPSTTTLSSDCTWTLRLEEKAMFDGIFESLTPVNGLLSGDKVKPVLINSKLPLDVLGKIWDLSDIDQDGHLDKEEFRVAMHLVYRARENETMPSTLPLSLVPPSKHKKTAGTLPGSVAVLPPSPFLLKENLRPTPAHGRHSPLGSTSGSLSPKHSFKSTSSPQPVLGWVVPLADRGRYDDIFQQADTDLDGLVGGVEVKDIFMNSGLPQSTLAHIWSLADTERRGKLTKEQFSLAMHFIQQKVTKGLEPPQLLTPDMIPPSERVASAFCGFLTPIRYERSPLVNYRRDNSSPVTSLELTGNKEFDDLTQEINQLQREKLTLEQEIREKEDALRQKNSDLQDMQGEVERENSGMQDVDSQTLAAQERLQDMEQQRTKLENKVNDMKNKCEEERKKISSLQLEVFSKEETLQTQEKELSRTKTDLYCLEQEESQLEDRIRAEQSRLESLITLLKASQNEMEEARSQLSQIQDDQQEVSRTIEEYNKALSGSLSDLSRLPELHEPTYTAMLSQSERDERPYATENSFKSRLAMFNSQAPKNTPADPFKSEDPFKSDPFQDPFGGDPFKSTDPFSSPDPFAPSPTKPNSSRGTGLFSYSKPKDSDPFASHDPFADSSFGGSAGFADFGKMSKGYSRSSFERKPGIRTPPSKKNLPPKPAPPPYSSSLQVTAAGKASGAHVQRVPADGSDWVPSVPPRGEPFKRPSLADLTAKLEVLSSEVSRRSWSGRSGRASGLSGRG
ncbi:epidermal growth factor receptor substrate 15-like 1 isoform X3 [Denticeps clupeoides]|uniref:epidermal growth factor receptor substrate 15-like 1 isoform X3 n=1 Tax=Denticeps clupeoides TaxID=299321 RepID=UPI0010A57926|nr:epidermal growth factor receptor substrate 15-like 1 isoform X3 [Denticeps clupeoides]